MYAEPIRIVQVHYPKAAMHAVGGAIALVPLLLPSVRDIFALAIVVGGFAAVAAGWLLLRLGFRSRAPLAQSLRLLARRGVLPMQGESFPALCRRAATMNPDLAPLLQAMADQQQQLAHAPLTASQRRHRLRQWRQLRSRLAQQPR